MKQSQGFIVTAIAAAVASHVTAAAAQDASQPSASELTEVTVTGSRIQSRIDEQPTPVLVTAVEQLVEFAPKSIADAVVQLPALAASPSRTGSGPGTNVGQTYLNMRGLGSTRSLVLMDGHRLVGSQASGEFDVSLIPQQLVKRVEVVTGGASAAYGSDAVAGVTNFILDTQFTGIKGQTSAGMSRYSDDETQRASLAVGHGFLDDRLHVIASLDWMNSSGAEGYASGGPNRAWATKRNFLIQNPLVTTTSPKSPETPLWIPADDVRYPYATNGGMIPSGPLAGTQFLAGGAAAPFRYGTQRTAQFMVGGDGGSSGGTWTLDMPMHSRVAFAHADFKLSNDVTLYAEGQYSSATTRAMTGTVYSFLGTAVTIFQNNAYLPADLRQRMVSQNIASFPLGRVHMDFGAYERRLTNEMQRFEAGAKGAFGNGWTWDAYAEYGRSNNDYYAGGGNFKIENLYRAADAVRDPVSGNIVCNSTLTNPGNGCVPINLLGEGSPSAEALAYVKGTAYALTEVTSKVVTAELTGEPASTWAGPLKIALGATYRDSSFTLDGDPLGSIIKSNVGIRGFPATLNRTEGGYQFGNVHSGRGGFDVSEIFGEALVPLLRDKLGAKLLNFNLATRYNNYSTVGEVWTWKAGLTYSPFDSLRLRSNISRDIRAPGLDQLYMSSPTGNLSVTDTIDGSNRVSQAQIQSPGNPDLKEETAKTITYGLVFTPTALPGFNASLDYYDIKIDDAVGRLGGQTLIDLCSRGDPEMCGMISRSGGAISVIRSLALNMSTLQTKGIDLEFGYAPKVSVGQLSFRAIANYVDSFVTKTKAGTVQDTTATIPTRLNFMANYRIGAFGFGLREQLLGSRKINNLFTPSDRADNHNPAYWYTDLNMTYQPQNRFGDMQLFLNINNLLDKDPPTAQDGAVGARAEINTMYNNLGRYFTAGMRFNF